MAPRRHIRNRSPRDGYRGDEKVTQETKRQGTSENSSVRQAGCHNHSQPVRADPASRHCSVVQWRDYPTSRLVGSDPTLAQVVARVLHRRGLVVNQPSLNLCRSPFNVVFEPLGVVGARGFEPRYAGLSARSSHSSQGREAPLRRPVIPGRPWVALTGARWSARLAYAPTAGRGNPRGDILCRRDDEEGGAPPNPSHGTSQTLM